MDDGPEVNAWAATVPMDLKADPIWRTPAYRLSLFAFVAHSRRRRLDRTTSPLSPASRPDAAGCGGISASLDEGYSRSSGRERAHFYEYALGSAREARGWYYKCAAAFPPDVLLERLALLTRIIKILTAVVPRERERKNVMRTRDI
jgi:hypothetical protein